MKKQRDSFTLRASVMAVHGALITLAMVPVGYAADAADLTKATNHVEIGLTNADKGSYKFGEYNGLQDKGLSVDAGFELRGGSAHDSGGTTRYGITGTNLGTDNRSLAGEFGEQGKFRINFGFDELRRNSSDSYQTPYLGAGSSNLALPRTWITPLQLNVNPNATTPVTTNLAANARTLDPNFIANDTVYRFNNAANATAVGAPSAPYAPTAAQTAAMLAVAANDTALFRNFDVFTTRKKYSAGYINNINTQWDVRVGVSRENREGTILRNAVSRNTGGDVAFTMPVVIDQKTDQFDLSLNYKDDKSHLTLAYYGSIFKNGEDVMTFENWAAGNGGVVRNPTITPFQSNLISGGAPSNELHQFSLTGGYDISRTTKLAVYASHSRNTQNQRYEYQEGAGEEVVPASMLRIPSSLDGRVDTTTFNLKLTAKPIKDLGLTAAYKYNNRDNKTAVHMYAYDDAGEGNVSALAVANANARIWQNVGAGIYATGPTVQALNFNANRPYSKKTQDFSLDADYNLGKGHALKAGVDYNKTERYCTGTWISCSDAPTSKEARLRAEWRAALSEDINAKLGYTRSNRDADYNEYAWLALVPMANYISSAAAAAGVTMSAYQTMMATGLNGFGPRAGYPVNSAGVAQTTAAQQIALLTAAGMSTALATAQQYYFPNNAAMAAANYGNVNIIADPYGFRRYFAASRDQDRVRGALNWQASERVSLDGTLELTKDKYPESVYGLQDEKSWALNLEAGFKVSDDLNTSVYYSRDERNQKNRSNARGANATTAFQGVATAVNISGPDMCGATTILARNMNQKINPCGDWGYDRTDKTDTIGITLRQKNLAGGKLDLKGDAIFARSKSDNATSSGTWVNNPAAVANATGVTDGAFFIPATPLPTVTTDTVTFRLNGNYKLDKVSAVRVGYSYNRLRMTDWQYDDRSIVGNGLATILPSNEKAPTYTVQTISASYLYSFK